MTQSRCQVACALCALLSGAIFCKTVCGQSASLPSPESAPPIVRIAGNDVPSEKASATSSANEGLDDLDALLDSDVTQLRQKQVAPALNLEVSSVSRQKSTIGKSPAAVFVITQEMIRRSGYRTLPDLLRMVPGLHVARITANKWSVSSRGFVDDYNQQLLVQIDGRSVYTPIFGGVVWNWHDMLLDDIERIEVIRGPGSTIWGANAVNGVINIITKKASQTHGYFAEAGGGTEERAFGGFRLGGRQPSGVDWRVSGKWFDRDNGFDPNGMANDGWDQMRLDWRMDWTTVAGDEVTVLGGLFDSNAGLSFFGPFQPFQIGNSPSEGGHFLYRWTRELDSDTQTSFQIWADHYDRGGPSDFILARQTTLDIDWHNQTTWNDRHRLIWGAEFRNIWDDLRPTSGINILNFNPQKRSAYFASAFIQDEVELQPESLFFTAGTKLTENSYTGFEVQPSLRLLRVLDERSVAWAAFSRSVRLPSRTDTNLQLTLVPGFLTAFGNPDAEAESVLSYEVGYRAQPRDWFSWDATAFWHDYNDLLTFVYSSPNTLTAVNIQDVTSYGIEVSSKTQLTERWELNTWYSFLHLTDDHVLPAPASTATSSPRHQAFLMSTFDITRCSDLDFILRYVDDLRNEDVGAYIQGDVRYAWRPTPNLELSIVGQNLFDSTQHELTGNPFVPEVSTLVQRGVYGMLQYRY